MSTEESKARNRRRHSRKAAQALPQMISDQDICKKLGVRVDTWRKHVRAGTAPLPTTTFGRVWLYPLAQILPKFEGKGWPGECKFKDTA